jgi:hypothetical protein
MDRQIEGRDSAEYLWAVKRVVHPSRPRTRTMRPTACPSRRASRTSSRTSRRLGPLDSGCECRSPTQPRYESSAYPLELPRYRAGRPGHRQPSSPPNRGGDTALPAVLS